MSTLPSRGPLTNRVLAELTTLGFPVGDNSSPDVAYGWQGEPDAPSSQFIPYLGLTPLNAQPQKLQAFSDSQSEWVFSYQVWYAGISRKQAEALADKARSQLCSIHREDVTTATGAWQIQQVRCAVIGGNSRVGTAYPDYYTQTDTFEVWASKER